MPYEPVRYVIVEVVGTRQRVTEVLDQLASANPEHWRKVYKMRSSLAHKGRACFTVDFQGDIPAPVGAEVVEGH